MDLFEKKISVFKLFENRSFDAFNNLDGLKDYTTDKYKIVRFAVNDEGDNGLALLDLVNKKIISWSLTGSSERSKFEELSKESQNELYDKNDLKAFGLFITRNCDYIQKQFDENENMESARNGSNPDLGKFAYDMFKSYNKKNV